MRTNEVYIINKHNVHFIRIKSVVYMILYEVKILVLLCAVHNRS